jgi:LPXTG-motif cell wall-anchored protein
MSKFKNILSVLSITLGIGLLISPVSNSSVALATSGGGGPIVLDGMDPVCHSGWESTGQYIAKVLKKVHDGARNLNNGHIAIVGSNATTTSCGADWATQLSTQFLAEFSTAPQIDFYVTDSEISTFFSSTITSNPPAVLWIPDNWNRASSTEDIFTANAEKIADFVNGGGGLFANFGSYGWLTALLPQAVYNNGGCNGGPEATTDGIADFGLSNTLVAACWHGYFTGNVGTLKTLVDYPYPSASDSRKSVSIGGGSVSLPSSFILSYSPQQPRAGEPITITATAQTLAGVPQAGVTVSMTVSSGPDSGQTFTATTDSNGIANITVNTASQGTAVYTASATVNGVVKVVSITVSWDPPAPTTTIETTTTVVATVPETTTTEPQIIVDPTTTTIHDHSTHDHGTEDTISAPLPTTGQDSNSSMGIGAFLITIGISIFMFNRKVLKNGKAN